MTKMLQAKSFDNLKQVLEERYRTAREVESYFSMDMQSFQTLRKKMLCNNLIHALRNSPFYQGALTDAITASLTSGDIGCLEQLPFTTRENIMDCYPFGMLAVPGEKVFRYGESSGTTTGKSISASFTRHDWLSNNITVAHFLSSVLTTEDIVAVAVPYELAGVGQDLDRSLELLGCTVVALGALTQFCPPERMISIMKNVAATTLVCSGTRALFLAETARKMGLDPRTDLSVDKILFAGEGASPAKTKILAEIWGAKVYSMYGTTETNTLAMFCKHNNLHLIESKFWFELIDPATDKPSAGDVGELTVTSINSEAMPLVRYRTGDLCKIEQSCCPCGNTMHTLKHMGRKTDCVEVNGSSINQLKLEDAIMKHLKNPPFYFCFKPGTEHITIGLTNENGDMKTRENIIAEVMSQFGVKSEFKELSPNVFESAIKSAVKPTMKSYLFE